MDRFAALMYSLCCSPVVFPVEDEEGRGDPRQVAVQLLQAAEEGHAQPQLHPARPAQLVAAQPRLTRGTLGRHAARVRDGTWTSLSEVTCSTLMRPICISGSSGLISLPSSSLRASGEGVREL